MTIRGVIEGFYGAFYTAPERDDLIRFLGDHGFNTYYYGPKNDRQHRARWREDYPDKIMAQFRQTVAVARDAGVTFCYALSPGMSMRYASDEDFDAITRKFQAFHDVGVRAFSLWLDDITPQFHDPADAARYTSYGTAHADLSNRVHAWLQGLDPACAFSMCPTDYHGSPPFSTYIHDLGAALLPAIDIFYTGPEICAAAISAADVDAFAAAVGRKPILWDNYPVNDLAMQPELHIGPIINRDPALLLATRGIALNLMLQAEGSKIPLLTYADFLTEPDHYDPSESWQRAMAQVAGDAAQDLNLFAENTLYSFLNPTDVSPLETRVAAALAVLKNGESVETSETVQALENYFTALDEAGYTLKFRMDNLALRHDLLPWIELLEQWVWTGRFALQVLTALERGEPLDKPLKRMNEALSDAMKHPKRIAGTGTRLLAKYTREQAANHRAYTM